MDYAHEESASQKQIMKWLSKKNRPNPFSIEKES